uniref:Uncharacterized protein LOC103409756 n=1 Tax=Rhizophora mucronata TaxID=61149 RepID=A0A2P2LHL3_RHIMU
MSIPVAKNIGRPVMNVVRFKGLPILQQLNIEEQLLRTSSDNWLIINDGTDDPTIVMGVSGYNYYRYFFFFLLLLENMNLFFYTQALCVAFFSWFFCASA